MFVFDVKPTYYFRMATDDSPDKSLSNTYRFILKLKEDDFFKTN